jgi:hypothetical protein
VAKKPTTRAKVGTRAKARAKPVKAPKQKLGEGAPTRKRAASSGIKAMRPRGQGSRAIIGDPVVEAVYRYVCDLALALPGSELGTSYGTPSIKVKGKFMARVRTEAEGGLAIRCDFFDRQMLLQAAPEAFYVTDHYRDHPMILIRLDQVRRDALPDIVERAWRMCAPQKLIDEFDAPKSTR